MAIERVKPIERDIGRLVELIRAASGTIDLPERKQQFALRTELEDYNGESRESASKWHGRRDRGYNATVASLETDEQ